MISSDSSRSHRIGKILTIVLQIELCAGFSPQPTWARRAMSFCVVCVEIRVQTTTSEPSANPPTFGCGNKDHISTEVLLMIDGKSTKREIDSSPASANSILARLLVLRYCSYSKAVAGLQLSR